MSMHHVGSEIRRTVVGTRCSSSYQLAPPDNAMQNARVRCVRALFFGIWRGPLIVFRRRARDRRVRRFSHIAQRALDFRFLLLPYQKLLVCIRTFSSRVHIFGNYEGTRIGRHPQRSPDRYRVREPTRDMFASDTETQPIAENRVLIHRRPINTKPPLTITAGKKK